MSKSKDLLVLAAAIYAEGMTAPVARSHRWTMARQEAATRLRGTGNVPIADLYSAKERGLITLANGARVTDAGAVLFDELRE